jgi:hypothetical protein
MIDTKNLNAMIEKWEPEAELVRARHSEDTTIRVVRTDDDEYYLYRYFTLCGNPKIHVSVDKYKRPADEIISYLMETYL